MQLSKPLRYQISDLRQLGACKSNNSQALKLTTSVFLNDDRLDGIRVQVIHEQFGVLYAYTFNAKGTLITPYEPADETSIKELLIELKKYGFLIKYNPVKQLSTEQLDFLATLDVLGFEKIRVLSVLDDIKNSQTKSMVVLFNVDKNPDWINNAYCTTMSELNKAFYEGSAFNVSAMSEAKKYDWTWLHGYVADIKDILEDNSGTLWRFGSNGQ